MRTSTDRIDLDGADTMTLTEHLGELRVRIIRSALAITIGAILDHRLLRPGARLPDPARTSTCACSRGESSAGSTPTTADPSLFIFDPISGLATRLRIASYGGLILAMPVVLWQIWRFIVPAMHAKEKRYAIPFIMTSIALFLLGACWPTSRWARRSSS